MKVKAIINFNDLEANCRRTVGEEFEVAEERGKFLLKNKAVEVVEEQIKKEKKSKKKKTGKK